MNSAAMVSEAQAHIPVYARVHTPLSVYGCTHPCLCMGVHTPVYAQVHTHPCLCMDVHTPIYAWVHTPLSTHRYTHLCTVAHTRQICTDSPPSLACHEEAIIQLKTRVKNTQDTTMIRAFPFPRSAWCSGDREAETGPHFRHVLTRPLREERQW